MKTHSPHNLWSVLGLISMIALVSVACASPSFDIETPAEMVELERDYHRYVAMTHDGVVLRALVYSQGERRSDDAPRAQQQFWADAVRERMRTSGGYALLDEEHVQSADGRSGNRLKFGRDQNGVPYQYWITIFVTDEHIHIIDVGGREDRFERAQEAVEAALSSYRVEL